MAPIYDALTHDLRLVNGRTLTLTIDTAQAPLKIVGIYAPHNEHAASFLREAEFVRMPTRSLSKPSRLKMAHDGVDSAMRRLLPTISTRY